jgi:predicted nucleotide-binding protein (sugar kinase/HSP70/actin superfamily)
VRSFTNHHAGGTRASGTRLPVNPRVERKIGGKTLLVPNWDPIACRLIAANFIREGVDARVLQEDATTIQKSLRHNTGQCIPLNAIAQEFIEYIERHNLAPENTLLWIPGSAIACNIKLYPYYIKSILEAHGRGLEKAGVYVGDTTFIDINPWAAVNMYFAYMFGGLIKKMGCKLRPYEITRGATDRAMAMSVEILYASFLGRRNREDAVKDVVSLFEEIQLRRETRPKVAIFGDLYSRDNDIMNQGLVHAIEDAGGEVITTPYSSYVKMVAEPYFKRWLVEKKYFDVVTSRTLLALVNILDRKYYRCFERIIKEPYPVYDVRAEEILGRFNVKLQNAGESLENLIKVFTLIDHYPDIALFVQASPAFCCPSLVTEAMTGNMERLTGIPVVSITYDGTGSVKNDVIIPYIKYPRLRGRGAGTCGEMSAS